jgi:glycine C-acetyltransferase
MYGKIKEHLQKELQTIEDNGIFKRKNQSPQGRFQQEKLF